MFPLDKSFKALADPTRRAILQSLRDKPRTAGEIAKRLSIAPSALSFHLRILKDADLIDAERRGQFIRYTLNSSVVEDFLRLALELLPAAKRKASDISAAALDSQRPKEA